MHINLIADSSIRNAPEGFTQSVQDAATILENQIVGDFTLNIGYGWGTLNNQVYDPAQGASGAFGAAENDDLIAGSKVLVLLDHNMTLPVQLEAMTSLAPVSDFIFVASAQEKAFGEYIGSASTIDGSFVFGTSTPSQFWLAGALHEITHAMGRTVAFYTDNNDPTIMNLFQFSAPGVHDIQSFDQTYISIDGGVTNLGNFSTVSDFGDMQLGSFSDPFNYQIDGSINQLTNLDILIMNLNGFKTVTVLPTIPEFQNVFQAILQHGPTTDQVVGWYQSTQTVEDLIQTLISSDEVTNQVRPVYQIIDLAKLTEPTPTQLNHWTQAIENGAVTQQQMLDAFIASDVFGANYNNGIDVNPNAPVTSQIMMVLYKDAMGITPTQAKIDNWTNSGVSIEQAVQAFALGDTFSGLSHTGLDNMLGCDAHAALLGIDPLSLTGHTV